MTPRKNNQTIKKGNITEFPGQSKQKKDQQKANHIPQGDLIEDLSKRLSCKEQAFMDLRIDEIKHFESIHDFKAHTRSAYPIVISFKDSGHCHCVDGWNLVQAVKEKGEDTIKCHLFYMDSFNIAAASIFKTALRSMPLGGTCSHAEMIVNIRVCFRLITGDTGIPTALGHGGIRKGSKYDNNLNQKIVGLLAEYLGKAKRKIREYMNHGNGLSDEILEYLGKIGAGRRFFEAIQKNKSNVIAWLEQEKVNPDSILKQVSVCTKEWYAEFKKTGEVDNILNKIELSQEEKDQIPDKIIAPVQKGPVSHKSWKGNSSIEDEPLLTKEQIYDELNVIVDPIIQFKEEQPDITEELIQQILNTARQLVNLSESMEHLLHQGQTDSEREVA